MDQSDPYLMSWEKTYAARDWGRYPTEDLIRFMARTYGKVANKSDVRVLEIRCGPCSDLWYLAREDYTAAGIDGSQIALDKGRERLRWTLDGVRVAGERPQIAALAATRPRHPPPITVTGS